jgi:hypothetical protein
MDWTGEHLIRSTGRDFAKVRRANAQRAGSGKRVPDHLYIAASQTEACLKEAADALGVSPVAVWKAAKRLGLKFRDGRKNG